MRGRALLLSVLMVAGTLVLPLPPAGATPLHVEGDIYSPTTWSIATSPVIISGNVTVHPGANLTIKEGTEVMFYPGTHLYIEGAMLWMAGTEAAPVRVLPYDAGAPKGSYDYIHVNNSLGPEPVQVAFTSFEGGVKGLYIESAQQVQVRNSTFSNLTEAGLWLAYSSTVGIHDCRFQNIDGAGVRLEGSSDVTVSGCDFLFVNDTAVDLWSSFHCSIQGGNVNGSLTGVALEGSGNDLVSSFVIEGADVGLELRGSTNCSFFDCTVAGARTGVLLNSSRDNSFTNCSFRSCEQPLALEGEAEDGRNRMDAGNTVNGAPILYLTGDANVLSGGMAGLVVMAGCTRSSVSNVSFPPGSSGVVLFRCRDCKVSDLNITSPYHGLLILQCEGLNVQRVSISGSSRAGAEAWYSRAVHLEDCRVSSSAEGGLELWWCANVSAARCSLSGNYPDFYATSALLGAVDCSLSEVQLDGTSSLVEAYTLAISVKESPLVPLAGADVKVNDSSGTVYASAHFGGLSAPTDGNGSLEPLAIKSRVRQAETDLLEPVTVEAWHDGMSFADNPRTVQLTAPSKMVFVGSPAGTVSGSVRDETGRPIEGAAVNLDEGSPVLTDPAGNFSFAGLGPGSYNITAMKSGWLPAVISDATLLEGQSLVRDIVMHPDPSASGSIEGVVVALGGTAVAGASVSLDGGGTALTDAGGNFSFSPAAAGWRNLTARAAGFRNATARVFVRPLEPTAGARLVLAPEGAGGTGGVGGQVLDLGLSPLEGASVDVEGQGGLSALSDANGSFLIASVPEGPWTLTFTKAGFEPATEGVLVAANQTASVVTILVRTGERPGRLTGSVRDLAGRPLAGARVSLDGFPRKVLTDEAGEFDLSRVRAGTYTARAAAAGFAEASEEGVEIAGGNTTRLEFSLGHHRRFQRRDLGVSAEGKLSDGGNLTIGRHLPPSDLRGSIGRFFEIEPAPGTSLTWLNITVSYDPAGLPPGTNESELRLFFWNGRAWRVCEGSGCDPASRTVWGNVTHLTVFGVGNAPPGGGGGTVVALPSYITPFAAVLVVIVVGVPIGILVIRMRTPADRKDGRPPPPI